jgi:putative ABC transport system permease protein
VSALPHLVKRRLLHEWPQTLILVACLAVAVLLPLAGGMLLDRHGRELRHRAAETPLLIGGAGSRFDLVLAALYFRPADLPDLPLGRVEAIAEVGATAAIPLHLRFTAQGRPLVGTEIDYFTQRQLAIAAGSMPRRLGDCVLGATAAASLRAGPGDRVMTDPQDPYLVAGAAPVSLRVAGTLAPSGGPDDEAVFVDLATAWLVEGRMHGHADPVALPEAAVFGRDGELFLLAEGIREFTEVTDENLASFHLHGDPAALPVSAVLAFPQDRRAAVLLASRVASDPLLQAIEPSEAVEELLDAVLRLKRFFDAAVASLAAATLLLAALIVALSIRARRGELRSMAAMGISRGAIVRLVAAEVLAVLLLAASLGAAGAIAIERWSPQVGAWLGAADALP